MRSLVLVGHPAPGSFAHALADAASGALAAFGPVLRHDPVADGFDPAIPAAEARGQPTADPLTRRYIAELKAAELLVVVHPVWWGGPPAILKGWIDRVLALNQAYGFPDGVDVGGPPIPLLTTAAALVVNTTNTDPAADTLADAIARIWADGILRYCGVRRVERQVYGVVVGSSAEQRAAWLADCRDQCAALAAAVAG